MLALQGQVGNRAVGALLAGLGSADRSRPAAPELGPDRAGSHRRGAAELRGAFAGGRVEEASAIVRRELGPGEPLPPGVARPMRRHFGVDLTDVRVHHDAPAAAMAAAIDARAFTLSQDIVFSAGQFRPNTDAGDALIAHEVAHTIQQRGRGPARDGALEAQAGAHALLGSAYAAQAPAIAPTIQREPTYPRRATRDQMIAEVRRVLSLTRDTRSSDPTHRMWSGVAANFGDVTAGSIARRVWTHIFARHFTEPESRGDVESRHPRYLYSTRYGWIDAQHFFGFIDFAEQQLDRAGGDRDRALAAATAQGLDIEQKQQIIRDYIMLQHEPARGPMRHMQVRPPNTALFRAPRAAAQSVTLALADIRASMLPGAQGQLYAQLDARQRVKFFMDSAKSAFTYEDFVSNQLGTQFLLRYADRINAPPPVDPERTFLAALEEFFRGIGVVNDPIRLEQLARALPTIERFEAPKTTEQAERRSHPELFR